MDPNSRYQGFPGTNQFQPGSDDISYNLHANNINQINISQSPSLHLGEFSVLHSEDTQGEYTGNGLNNQAKIHSPEMQNHSQYPNHLRPGLNFSKQSNFKIQNEHFPALPTAKPEDVDGGYDLKMLGSPSPITHPGLMQRQNSASPHIHDFPNTIFSEKTLFDLNDEDSFKISRVTKHLDSRISDLELRSANRKFLRPAESGSSLLEVISSEPEFYTSDLKKSCAHGLKLFTVSKDTIKNRLYSTPDYAQKKEFLKKADEASLFNAFYFTCGHVDQALAGLELLQRGWRLRKVDRLWYRYKDSNVSVFQPRNMQAHLASNIVDFSLAGDFFAEDEFAAAIR